MQSFDRLIEKWAPVLNEESAGKIVDHQRRAVTAAILENQEKAMMEERAQHAGFGSLTETAGNSTGSIGTWDPVLISLVRRAMPNLMAYDVCGVQPMSGPTGLIFAMKSRYEGGSTAKPEAFFGEAKTGFSGDGSVKDADGSGLSGWDGADALTRDTDLAGKAIDTNLAEALGNTGGAFAEMGFTIEKATVTAQSRALKAEYSLELAQDLKAIHGLDAETELANILSTEILAEINREVIRTINSQAKTGASTAQTALNGVFDLANDADGRWSVEKFKGLMFQVEREANAIAKQTRRGKGNVVICSSDVASALQMAGVLDYAPALNSNNLQVDDTGNTFAGVLQGKYRVYIDPYAANVSANQYYVVGYKGSSPYDAGLFYCPYVPLQMVRAVGEDTFQPKIGFKTRYGMVANPFANGLDKDLGAIKAGANRYYRRVAVKNLM